MKKLSETRYMQFLAAIAAGLSGPATSAHMSWPSPGLPILQSEESPVGRPLTIEEGSWLVSIMFLMVIPGGIVGGYVAERFGRKPAMLLGGIVCLTAWIIIFFAQNLVSLYIARSIAGISFGVIAAVAYLYIGEIADDDIRGTLAMVNTVFSPIASLLILAAGPYMSYKPLVLVCGALSMPLIALFVWMPETPLFFLKNGNVEAAKRSLIRLSAKNTDNDCIHEKLVKLQKLVSARKTENKLTVIQIFTNWMYLKPFLLVAGIQVMSLLSGVTAIESYMQTIITASKSSLSPEASSIVFGIVKIPPVFVAIVLCDRLGRRPLFTISALVCALSLFSEGLYFYIQEFYEDYTSNISWLPTTALSVFMILYPIGLTSIPYVLQSELFPSESKEMSSAFLQTFMGLAAFAVAKSFAPLADSLGTYTMFWFFSSVCLFGVVYIFAFIPETKGKSFAEIQEKMSKKEHILRDTKSKNPV